MASAPEPPALTEVELRVTVRNPPVDFLNRAKVGDRVNIWSRPDLPELRFYEKGTVGGQGLITAPAKTALPLLANRWAEAKGKIHAIGLDDCVIACTFIAPTAEVEAAQHPKG